MPVFEVSWQAQGLVRVEADDEAEAKQLMEDGVSNFDHSMFDVVDVTNIEATDCDEL